MAENYRALAACAPGVSCGAVVKANAYGLGLSPVARTLAATGCREFFVANIDEGVALRRIAAESGFDAAIYILAGAGGGGIEACVRHGLTPVLQTPSQMESWAQHGRQNRPARVALEFDTGMSRLGMTRAEADAIRNDRALLKGLDVALIVSHLACADEPDHPQNAEQLRRFRDLHQALASPRASLANSAGILLGPDFHFDLVRPGAAIYGIVAGPGIGNIVRPAVELSGRILRVRDVDSDSAVGYGATARVGRGKRLATVAVGYADGYLRALSNRGCGYIGSVKVPLVGRVSMDLTVFDVSAVPPEQASEGDFIQLIGPHHSADDVASDAGTIGYEILAALGTRYRRRYIGGP